MSSKRQDEEAIPPGSTCANPNSTGRARSANPLSGGCCAASGEHAERLSMGRSARSARAVAGLGWLTLAGFLGTRRLPGRISLWPTAVVPTWFGVSHLVAGVIGYRGCPELGAIPSVMLARRVETDCGIWEHFDRRFDSYHDPRGEPEPLTCTRSNNEVAEIGGLLFSVAGHSLTPPQRTANGYRLHLAAREDVAASLHEFAHRDKECSFLDFEIDEQGDEIRLEVTGPPAANDVLDLCFAVARQAMLAGSGDPRS
jgi:hypothetical protein